MREVSHFLLELRNGSESREVHEIPPSVPENEALPDPDPLASHHLPSMPASVDPLQSASPATRVSGSATRAYRNEVKTLFFSRAW